MYSIVYTRCRISFFQTTPGGVWRGPAGEWHVEEGSTAWRGNDVVAGGRGLRHGALPIGGGAGGGGGQQAQMCIRDRGELVARGRYPHQTFWRPWRAADGEAVREALEQTGLLTLADRPMGTLSGGQRQRAWLAFALAQNAPLMLLDEPTTYLDIAHQLEVLDLCRRLNRRQGLSLIHI